MSRESSKLATGDAIFLSFLLWGPRSAYDIKKAMSVSVSHFWSAAHSQVYQQATRLARDGFLKEKDALGARRKKVLSLTPKGRRAVDAWLRAPAGEPELRDESLAKLFFAAHGDVGKTIEMLEDQRAQHAAKLTEFEGIRAALEEAVAAGNPDAPFQLDTLKLGLQVTQAYLRWTEDTLERLTVSG
jgi:PadR family transcriptional regulator AphA